MSKDGLQEKDGNAVCDEKSRDASELSFEEILVKLGHLGKFQLIQCTICLVPLLLNCFTILGFVFIGYTPDHECNKVNETELLATFNLLNDSTAKVVYGQCDVTVSSNQTGRMTSLASLSCPNGRHFPAGKDLTLVSEWDLVCESTGHAEYTQLLLNVGTILGGIVIPPIADRFGRKPVLIVSSISNVIIDFVIAFAPNLYVVSGLLFLDGLAVSGLSCTYVILGMEMLIAKHRQVFGIIICVIWVLFTLIVGFVGYLLQYVSWRYFQATGALTGLPCLLIPIFACESTRWLAINGKTKEALQILKKASRQNGKDFSEIQEVFKNYMKSLYPSEDKKECVMNEEDSCSDSLMNADAVDTKPDDRKVAKYTLWDLLSRSDTLVRLLVIWYLWTTCNLVYYGIFISASDLAGNRFINFCLLSVVEIPSNILAVFMMGKMGRLTVTRIFLCLAAFSLLGSVLINEYGDETQTSDIISVSLFIFGKFAVTSAFNVIFILTPEIFPTVLRSTGNGSCRAVPKIGSLLAPYSRPLYTIAKWAPGTIFSSMCFIGLLLSSVLPETKDQNLPTQLKDVRKKTTDQSSQDMKTNDILSPVKQIHDGSALRRTLF